MNEALAAGQEPQGTEELDVSNEEALQASGENEDAEAAPQGETPQEQPSEDKKLSGFARRMQKLELQVAAQVEAAKQEAEYWKQQALKSATPQEPTKTRLDFASDDEWIEHRLEQERKNLLREAQEAAANAHRTEQVVSTYKQRVAAAKQELPDWDEVFANAQANGATLPQHVVEYCLDSEAGAKIAYHLAKNEDEFDKFMSLPPAKQLAYLGKLEDRVSKPKAPVETKKVTQAPEKLTSIKTGSPVKSTPTGIDRFSSKQAWREWRAQQGKR